jgi:predicted nucleic acid-binding protein
LVFVDTSALYAALDKGSPGHREVLGCLAELARQGTGLVTTSYVLVETGILVRKRLGPKAFRALGASAERIMEILWVDGDLHRRAWARASKSGKKGPGLVDWVSFIVMRDQSITTALTLDAHFARQGFETLP